MKSYVVAALAAALAQEAWAAPRPARPQTDGEIVRAGRELQRKAQSAQQQARRIGDQALASQLNGVALRAGGARTRAQLGELRHELALLQNRLAYAPVAPASRVRGRGLTLDARQVRQARAAQTRTTRGQLRAAERAARALRNPFGGRLPADTSVRAERGPRPNARQRARLARGAPRATPYRRAIRGLQEPPNPNARPDQPNAPQPAPADLGDRLGRLRDALVRRFGEVRAPAIEAVLRRAREHALDPVMFAALAAWESRGFNAKAKSPTGVVGVLQVTQRTQAYVGVTGPRTDPNVSAEAGARYFRMMLRAVGVQDTTNLPANDRRVMAALSRYNGADPNQRRAHGAGVRGWYNEFRRMLGA